MRDLTAREYGYRGIVFAALRHMYLAKMATRAFDWSTFGLFDAGRVFRVEDKDADDGKARPFCSHAVAMACRRGGGVDVVPNLPDWACEPGQLSRSMFFRYEFSIARI